MKKTITLIFMSLFIISLTAQEFKTKETGIYKKLCFNLYSTECFSSDGTSLYHHITLNALNDKYTHINDLINLCVFNPNEMMFFLDYIVNFTETGEEKTSQSYKKMSLYIDTKRRGCMITTDNGYYIFKKKDLIGMQLACKEFIETISKSKLD